MAVMIIKAAAALVIGLAAGCGAIYIFNKMPARWLCDYGQTPPQELTDPYIRRIKGFPWRWIYSAGFACLMVRLLFVDVQLAAAGLFACWALLLLGALIGGGVMLMTGVLGGAAFSREVLGFGDVKLFASLGLALGIKGTVVVLIGSSICSGIAAAAGLASGRYKKDDVRPLGPYICAWGAFYIFILWPFLMK